MYAHLTEPKFSGGYTAMVT